MRHIAAAVLLTTAVVAGQGGPMASFAQAISIPGKGTPIMIKLPGDQSGIPPFPIPMGLPGVPDFNLDVMFGPDAQHIDIDAMSTGNDIFPIDPLTLAVTPGDGWVAMAFSVDQKAEGQPNSTIAARALPANPIGPGGDTRTFYFDGSEGIGAGLVGQTLMPITAEQTGFSPMGSAVEIDAMDSFLPVLLMNDGNSSLMVQSTIDFYFSLTEDSAKSLPSGFFGSLAPSGAHVMRMTWGYTTNGGAWSTPAVQWSAASLGLDDDDEVDAIGVFNGNIVFSTADTSQPPLSVPTSSGPGEVVRQGGASITAGIQIQTGDDLDAFCGFDPESGVYSYWMGFPERVRNLKKEMHLSLARFKLPSVSNEDLLRIVVSGWGRASPSSGDLVFEVFDGQAWNPIWIESRSPQEDVFTTDVAIPSPPGLGLEVPMRAVFVSSDAGAEIVASYAVVIRV